MRSVARVVSVVHFPAHDLAAVKIQDQVQVEPLANHGGRQAVMSQHQTWRGAAAMCVVGGRPAFGALARPRWSAWPCARKTRAKLDSLAKYRPSLATLSTCARSAGLSAWAGTG